MIIRVKQQSTIEVIKDIVCDCCGKSCRDKANINYEYATFHAGWGFASANDLDEWESHLCEVCALKVKTFIESQGGKVRITKITPQIIS